MRSSAAPLHGTRGAWQWWHAGEVELSATKYAPYAGPATECRVCFERLAGFREGRLGQRYPDEIVLYLAPLFDDAPPMPVRMHGSNLFGALRLHLVHGCVSITTAMPT